MDCISCNGKVPSLMNHALTLNQCPYCGDSIFDKSAGALVLVLKKQVFVESEVLNDQIINIVLDTVLDKFNISPKQIIGELEQAQHIQEEKKGIVAIKRSESLRSEVDMERRVSLGIANIEDIADLEQGDLDLLNVGIPEHQKITIEDVARAKELKNKMRTQEEPTEGIALESQMHTRKPIARRG